MTILPNEAPAQAQVEVRKDIQALRAIAVILVVAFHLFPKLVPNGFVGVDAFFVISGYLITSHLLREAEGTGGVRVTRFWAARARRLLPASFLVLLCCLVCAVTLIPVSYQERFLEETMAALYYALNWTLAADAVDYWAAEEAATAVQHFWSLAVEEQFYLVWPLLFILALFVRRAAKVRQAARWMVLAVLALSLSLSVRSGFHHDPADYFRTWNRAWEFAVGGALALWSAPRLRPPAATGLAWLGLGLTLGAAWLLPDDAAFPGAWALIPVVGTALCLWFGGGDGRATISTVLGGSVMQWVGNASYAIYLWHWPLIVSYRTAFERKIDGPSAAILVLATVVLAALTKAIVEDPVRYHPFLLRRPPWVTFALVATAMTGLTFATSMALEAQSEITDARHPLVKYMRKQAIPCFGALSTPGCSNPAVAGKVLPNPSAAKADRGKICMTDNQGGTKVRRCPRGAKKDARFTTALVGDSHAAHFLPMLEFGAKRRQEQIVQYLKGSCPFSAHARDTADLLEMSCEAFKAKVIEDLKEHPEIERVVLSASAGNDLVVLPGMEQFESAVLGYMESISGLPEHVKEVIVIRDVPRMKRGVIQCLERLETRAQLKPGACSSPRDVALIDDPLAEAARRLGGRVHLFDFTDAFCTQSRCSPVIHNALAYRDTHHLTETFAITLASRYARELKAIAEKRAARSLPE